MCVYIYIYISINMIDNDIGNHLLSSSRSSFFFFRSLPARYAEK